jgi:hypothetical protein
MPSRKKSSIFQGSALLKSNERQHRAFGVRLDDGVLGTMQIEEIYILHINQLLNGIIRSKNRHLRVPVRGTFVSFQP